MYQTLRRNFSTVVTCCVYERFPRGNSCLWLTATLMKTTRRLHEGFTFQSIHNGLGVYRRQLLLQSRIDDINVVSYSFKAFSWSVRKSQYFCFCCCCCCCTLSILNILCVPLCTTIIITYCIHSIESVSHRYSQVDQLDLCDSCHSPYTRVVVI